MANDINEGVALTGLIGPSRQQFTPTFDDDNDLEFLAYGFILNTSGAIHYEDSRGNEHTYDFPAGQYDIMVKRIYTSGTTVAEDDILCLV